MKEGDYYADTEQSAVHKRIPQPGDREGKVKEISGKAVLRVSDCESRGRRGGLGYFRVHAQPHQRFESGYEQH